MLPVNPFCIKMFIFLNLIVSYMANGNSILIAEWNYIITRSVALIVWDCSSRLQLQEKQVISWQILPVSWWLQHVCGGSIECTVSPTVSVEVFVDFNLLDLWIFNHKICLPGVQMLRRYGHGSSLSLFSSCIPFRSMRNGYTQ